MTTITGSRRPSSGLWPRLALFGVQVRTEVASARRSAEYVVGLVVVPTLLYAMFGLTNDATWIPGGSPFSTIAIASFGAYGVVSLAIFTFCDEVAKERGRGWIKTLTATPIPLASHLAAKVSMACVYSLLIVASLAAVSIPTGASNLGGSDWAALTFLLLGGVVAFSTLGFAVAFLIRPKAATTISNLVFLPLAFGSGFFFPLSEVPAFVRGLAPFLPTYHFGRLVWSTVATETEIELFTGITGQPTVVHLAWVAGLFVSGAAVTWWAVRRTTRTR